MAESFTRVFLRDDGVTEVEVDIEVSSWGSPAHYGSPTYPGHPADPPECEVVGAHLVDGGHPVVLTAEEYERAEAEFLVEPPELDDPYWLED